MGFFQFVFKKICLLLCILMYFQNYSNWSDVLEQYFTYCSYGNVLNRKFENEKKKKIFEWPGGFVLFWKEYRSRGRKCNYYFVGTMQQFEFYRNA
jgi:hypothetical protein